MTKASALTGAPECRVADGRRLAARVLGVDPAYDLALLKVESDDLPPVNWADENVLTAGMFVASVGPAEMPPAVGVVSVPPRSYKETGPNNLPAAWVTTFPPSVIGEVVPGRGYMVKSTEGSATDAGVKSGDVITRLDGEPVRSHEDLMRVTEGRSDPELSELLIDESNGTTCWMQDVGKHKFELARSVMGVKVGNQIKWPRGAIVRTVHEGVGLSATWRGSSR